MRNRSRLEYKRGRQWVPLSGRAFLRIFFVLDYQFKIFPTNVFLTDIFIIVKAILREGCSEI
ncbi:MAG: hypothetical protein CSA35_01615 [Dethiosulfovibrio peptidovorans]|nr:MAG: hypothetical protein CSA35_01615 [Dethiosulfovibrio peptidovorans]